MKRTQDFFDCDKCGKDGKRYSVTFEDGTLVLDRCPDHGKALERLRNEKGEWVTVNQLGRNVFRKSTPAELRLAVLEGQNRRAAQDGDKG